MIVVLDTNIIIAGTRSNKGASFQILSMIQQKKIEFLLSVPLFLEYEAVLKRPEQIEKSNLTLEDADILLNMLANRAKKFRLHYLWRPQLRDPKDEMVLELALNGNADAIVTFNIDDFANVSKNFNIKILTPSKYYFLLKKGIEL